MREFFHPPPLLFFSLSESGVRRAPTRRRRCFLSDARIVKRKKNATESAPFCLFLARFLDMGASPEPVSLPSRRGRNQGENESATHEGVRIAKGSAMLAPSGETFFFFPQPIDTHPSPLSLARSAHLFSTSLPKQAGGRYRFSRRSRSTENSNDTRSSSSSKSLVALALSLAAAAALLATSSLLLAANAPRPGGVTLAAPRRSRTLEAPPPPPPPRGRFSRSRPVALRSGDDGGKGERDGEEEGGEGREDEAEAATARALAAVASLRQLFDQQRSSQTPEQASEPSAAGLRAASAAALDAAALADGAGAASAALLAAKQRAEKLVLDSLLRRQFPQDCSRARFLVGAIDKFCGFACQVHHAVHLLAAAAATDR